jgi:hypothetical protein
MSATFHESKTASIAGGVRPHSSVLYAVLFAVTLMWPAGLLAAAITGSAQVLGAAILVALVAPTMMTGLAAIGWWGPRAP